MYHLTLRYLALMFIFTSWLSNAYFDNNISKNNAAEFQSVVINEQLSLNIYLPKSHKAGTKKYPTMYVMNGDSFFYNAIAFQKSLRFRANASPEFIVVGINIKPPEGNPNFRWNYFSTQAKEAIALLENDVIAYIEKHYPSNKNRMYFGWEAAAGFGLEIFNHRPELIKGYFLASSPNYTDERLNKTAEILKTLNNAPVYFYLSLGAKETYATTQHETLAKSLQNSAKKGVKSHYLLSSKLNHHTSPLDSFTHGLLWYFSDYPNLFFDSVEAIQSFGGIAKVKEYYHNRGERYELDKKVANHTKFAIFRRVVEAKDWALFKKFEDELGAFTLDKHSSEYWYTFFGNFYIDNHAYKKAEKLFQQGLTVNPQSNTFKQALTKINTLNN